jgi:hypothetical protein
MYIHFILNPSLSLGTPLDFLAFQVILKNIHTKRQTIMKLNAVIMDIETVKTLWYNESATF